MIQPRTTEDGSFAAVPCQGMNADPSDPTPTASRSGRTGTRSSPRSTGSDRSTRPTATVAVRVLVGTMAPDDHALSPDGHPAAARNPARRRSTSTSSPRIDGCADRPVWRSRSPSPSSRLPVRDPMTTGRTKPDARMSTSGDGRSTCDRWCVASTTRFIATGSGSSGRGWRRSRSTVAPF